MRCWGTLALPIFSITDLQATVQLPEAPNRALRLTSSALCYDPVSLLFPSHSADILDIGLYLQCT